MLEVWRWRAGRHWLSRHPTVLSSCPVRHSCCAVRYTVLHTENRTNLVQAAQQTVSLTQTHLNQNKTDAITDDMTTPRHYCSARLPGMLQSLDIPTQARPHGPATHSAEQYTIAQNSTELSTCLPSATSSLSPHQSVGWCEYSAVKDSPCLATTQPPSSSSSSQPARVMWAATRCQQQAAVSFTMQLPCVMEVLKTMLRRGAGL